MYVIATGTSSTRAISEFSNNPRRMKWSSTYDGVKNFVVFVGYSRSGSTIVASMLDAHPNIIVSNENNFMMKWWEGNFDKLNRYTLYSLLCQDSRISSTNGTRSQNRTLRKGYSIGIESLWQGRYANLTIIGNKRAEKLTKLFIENPFKMKEKYKHLQASLKVPIIAIHVIRNPFDMVATRMFYAHGSAYPHKLLNQNVTKLSNDTLMKKEMSNLFDLAEMIMQMEQSFKFNILHIHIEDFVKDANTIIKEMCEYLHVPCADWYVHACAKAVFPKISRTRDLVEWKPDAIHTMKEKIRQFPFFDGYTYKGDFYDSHTQH